MSLVLRLLVTVRLIGNDKVLANTDLLASTLVSVDGVVSVRMQFPAFIDVFRNPSVKLLWDGLAVSCARLLPMVRVTCTVVTSRFGYQRGRKVRRDGWRLRGSVRYVCFGLPLLTLTLLSTFGPRQWLGNALCRTTSRFSRLVTLRPRQ